ncbi:Uncharacterised protein [Acinetobacter baumannii]|nr:hypothetical protein AbaMCR56_15780 [Acinetobacter baumannii]RSC30140.1 hypothetical protein EGS47_01485 [Acinetobacter sp. FDAARGOS_515]SSS28791.1 Uncharacterised protein [Acinetobacter baumannii]HAV5523106.1 hypothetical protein [Acinetobacter baumannii]
MKFIQLNLAKVLVFFIFLIFFNIVFHIFLSVTHYPVNDWYASLYFSFLISLSIKKIFSDMYEQSYKLLFNQILFLFKKSQN